MVCSPEVCSVLWHWPRCTNIQPLLAAQAGAQGTPGEFTYSLSEWILCQVDAYCKLWFPFPSVFPLPCPKPDQCVPVQGPRAQITCSFHELLQSWSRWRGSVLSCAATDVKQMYWNQLLTFIFLFFNLEQITWIVRGKLKQVTTCFLEQNGGWRKLCGPQAFLDPVLFGWFLL